MQEVALFRTQFAGWDVPALFAYQVFQAAGAFVLAMQQCTNNTRAPVKVDLNDRKPVQNAVNEGLVIAQGFDFGGNVNDDAIVSEMGHSAIERINGGHRIHTDAGSPERRLIEGAGITRLRHEQNAWGQSRFPIHRGSRLLRQYFRAWGDSPFRASFNVTQWITSFSGIPNRPLPERNVPGRGSRAPARICPLLSAKGTHFLNLKDIFAPHM